MSLGSCSGGSTRDEQQRIIVLLLLDPDAFSTLAKLFANIFGLSLEKTHLAIYTRVLKVCVLKVRGTEELEFTKVNFSQKNPSVPLSATKIKWYFQAPKLEYLSLLIAQDPGGPSVNIP